VTGALRRCRVLLVDDEADFATATAQRLERRGFEVRFALDGEAALAAARAAPPDVVVLDVRLAGEDGLAVLAGLKRDQPGLEVILLTGHASAGDGLEGMRLGAFDYVLKPVAIEELCVRLEAAWARRRAAAG
jgi:DNA-binding response OmpR family regulator